MLADSSCELAAARARTYKVAWEMREGLDPKEAHAKASMVTLFASEMARRVSDRAVQILGGRGYMRDHPVERLWRDTRVDRIWEGTSEIQRLIIARGLQKRGVAALTPLTGPRGCYHRSLHPELEEAQIEHVIECVRAFFGRGAA